MANSKKIKNTKSYLLLFPLFVLMLLSTSSVLAQPTQRFSFEYQALDEADDVTASLFRGHIAHQFLLDDEGMNLLTAGIRFSEVQLEDESLFGPDSARDLQVLAADINYMRVLNDEYSLVVSLRPGYYGELSSSFSDSFRVEGGVVVTKFINSNLTMGLGVGRGTNFGRDLIVPLLQFVYFPSDKVVIRGLLPIRASVWYIPNQSWELGFIFRLDGSLYNIDQSNISGAEQLGIAAAHVGLAARYKLFGNNFLSVEGGYMATRRYEWTDSSGTSFDIGQDPFQEREIGNAPYVRFGWIQKF